MADWRLLCVWFAELPSEFGSHLDEADRVLRAVAAGGSLRPPQTNVSDVDLTYRRQRIGDLEIHGFINATKSRTRYLAECREPVTVPTRA